MLEDHLESLVTRRRLRAGPAADHVDRFADWLHHQGYKRVPCTHILRSLAVWADWFGEAGYTVHDAVAALDACKALLARGERVRYARGPSKHSLSTARLFIRFLQQDGVLPHPQLPPSPAQRWPVLVEFRTWMQHQRCLRDSSLDTYQGVVVDLLEAFGDAPLTYTASQVRDFVLQRAEPHGIWRAKSITTAVRAFLRFLAATGRCSIGLDHAVPEYASWSGDFGEFFAEMSTGPFRR